MRTVAAALAALVMSGAFLLPHAVDADNPPASFTIGPATFADSNVRGRDFAFQLSGGQTRTDSVAIKNQSDVPLTMDLYGADVRQASGGGLSPAQQGADMADVGSWIRVGEPHFVLVAGERKVVSFIIAPPANVAPGDHLGAIVAQAIVGRSGNVALQARGALLTEVTVPGAMHFSVQLSKLRTADTGDRKRVFTATINNHGNLVVSVVASVGIQDGSGRQVTAIPLQPSSFTLLPGATLDLHTDAYAFGYGSFLVQASAEATVEGRPFNQTVKTNVVSIDFVNWPEIMRNGFIGLVIALAAMFLLVRRRKPRNAPARRR